MTKHTHTPGPWGFSLSGPSMRDGYSQSFAVFEAGEQNLIAGCFSDVRGGNEVAAANARHIVMAVNAHDEMLAALEAAVDYWKDTTVASRTDTKAYAILVQMRAALEKARGT